MLTHITKFVIHVTKFVTKNIYAERKKYHGLRKNYHGANKKYLRENFDFLLDFPPYVLSIHLHFLTLHIRNRHIYIYIRLKDSICTSQVLSAWKALRSVATVTGDEVLGNENDERPAWKAVRLMRVLSYGVVPSRHIFICPFSRTLCARLPSLRSVLPSRQIASKYFYTIYPKTMKITL